MTTLSRRRAPRWQLLGMEMLTSPVYCQGRFYFCTATPRPGQHLLQQTGGRDWFPGRESKAPGSGSCPQSPGQRFCLLLHSQIAVKNTSRTDCPHFADGKLKAQRGSDCPDSRIVCQKPARYWCGSRRLLLPVRCIPQSLGLREDQGKVVYSEARL